jgi:uncharacterized membrane protein
VSRRAPRGRVRTPEHPAPPPARDWLVVAVAAIGFVIAGYLTVTKLMGGGAVFCTTGGGCDAVQSSRYATLLWVPTALWGALAYAAIGGLAAAGWTVGRWQAAFAIASGAVGFSAYLTWLSMFDLRALCVYCLASGAVAVTLLGLLVWRRPALSRRSSKPARLVMLGGAAAVGTIVIGAGIFAANPESADPAYRQALVRHLAARGMTMYGSFT